jgi:transposase-like protein
MRRLERMSLTMEQRLAAAPDPALRYLVERLGHVEGSRTYLERLRWPDGIRCPRCESASVLRIRTRRKYYCTSCRYQFRVTAGTRLHDSHIPGWKWLVAVDLMLSERVPVSAAQLQGVLGGGYRTSWFLEHRIREALAPAPSAERSARAKHPRYRAAYAAEAYWRASGGTPAARFRQTVLALLEAEPLAYRELISRPA